MKNYLNLFLNIVCFLVEGIGLSFIVLVSIVVFATPVFASFPILTPFCFLCYLTFDILCIMDTL